MLRTAERIEDKWSEGTREVICSGSMVERDSEWGAALRSVAVRSEDDQKESSEWILFEIKDMRERLRDRTGTEAEPAGAGKLSSLRREAQKVAHHTLLGEAMNVDYRAEC